MSFASCLLAGDLTIKFFPSSKADAIIIGSLSVLGREPHLCAVTLGPGCFFLGISLTTDSEKDNSSFTFFFPQF